MKRLLLPIAVLLFIAYYCSGCKKETDNNNQELTFSVLAYNVAGLPQFISSSKPELYSSAISPLLNQFNIVHLQEDFCYHDSILLYNQHPYRTETTGCVPGGDGLNTLSDYPITNLIRQAWTHCTFADCLTPKGFSYSIITLPNGDKIDFYNIHCNAGSSPEAMQARRANIKQVCAFISEYSANNATIIMGDFNCRYTRSGDSIRALLDMGFRDVWLDQIRNGTIPDANDQSLNDCDNAKTHANCERVDKIFYRSNAKLSITPTSYQLDDPAFYYQGNSALPLSDHWPVMATFTITKK